MARVLSSKEAKDLRLSGLSSRSWVLVKLYTWPVSSLLYIIKIHYCEPSARYPPFTATIASYDERSNVSYLQHYASILAYVAAPWEMLLLPLLFSLLSFLNPQLSHRACFEYEVQLCV